MEIMPYYYQGKIRVEKDGFIFFHGKGTIFYTGSGGDHVLRLDIGPGILVSQVQDVVACAPIPLCQGEWADSKLVNGVIDRHATLLLTDGSLGVVKKRK